MTFGEKNCNIVQRLRFQRWLLWCCIFGRRQDKDASDSELSIGSGFGFCTAVIKSPGTDGIALPDSLGLGFKLLFNSELFLFNYRHVKQSIILFFSSSRSADLFCEIDSIDS